MEPWVIVAGGFHRKGGMDRLNWALARHLIKLGNPVHLVCHSIEPELREGVRSVDIVPRPGNSFMLGGFLLNQRGRGAAQRLTKQSPRARVVINGGNCNWPDINWAHCVHHAWERNDRCSPAWFKLKSRVSRWQACWGERSALRSARVVIANSERTRRDLINLLEIAPDRIHVVYPGVDPAFAAPNPGQRATAREWLGKDGQPLVGFVGALGYDLNKGFDVLLSAWSRLCARSDWDADLIVAGGGRALDFWRRQIAEAGLGGRITLLGFSDRIPELLAATDLLVSPVRYEAYGLNVQEAICSGVPAIVSQSAGVAERYPVELRELLIPNPEDVEDLTARILRWRAATDYWKVKIRSFSQELGMHTLEAMALQIITVAGAPSLRPNLST